MTTMDRTALRETLIAMRERGPVTASAYVTEVSPPDHPLHDTLEWDDDKAGHEYRLIQARKIIVLVRDKVEDTKRTTPLFVHVPSSNGGEGEYELAYVLASQPDRLEAARRQVIGQLDAANENLDDLSAIVERYGKSTERTRRRTSSAHRHIDKAREVVLTI